jgi:hypothetical protein
MGVAIGSSIQIALFVTPFLVVLGWIMDRDMDLHFETCESSRERDCSFQLTELQLKRLPLGCLFWLLSTQSKMGSLTTLRVQWYGSDIVPIAVLLADLH